MRDLFISCPFHGEDKTPSLSIVLQEKGDLRPGFAHCFGCGWSGNYKQVEQQLGHKLAMSPEIRARLEQVGHPTPNTSFGLRTVVQRDVAQETYRKQDLPFKYSRYLKDRGIGEVVQRANKIYQNGDKVYMPIFNTYGIMTGTIQRSATEHKFYKVEGTLECPIGLESVYPKDFVYVTEGQIDKMTLEQGGFRAVALGTVSNYKLIRHIKNFNICFAFDNDDAGRKATQIAFEYIKLKRAPNLYVLQLPEQVKDINQLFMDMKSQGEPDSTFTDWVKANTFRL